MECFAYSNDAQRGLKIPRVHVSRSPVKLPRISCLISPLPNSDRHFTIHLTIIIALSLSMPGPTLLINKITLVKKDWFIRIFLLSMCFLYVIIDTYTSLDGCEKHHRESEVMRSNLSEACHIVLFDYNG